MTSELITNNLDEQFIKKKRKEVSKEWRGCKYNLLHTR